MSRYLFLALSLVLVACSQFATQVATAQADQTELLKNGSFEGGLVPWWTTPTVTAAGGEAGACLAITAAGTNPWDAILGQHEIPVSAGGDYTLTFRARADAALSVRVVLQENDGAYTPYFSTDMTSRLS